MGNVGQSVPVAATLGGDTMRSATDEGQRVVEFVRQRDAADHLREGDVLSRRRFLGQLQIEKRRTDRSKVPLSLVLFRFTPEQRGRPGNMAEIVGLLRQCKRETDLLGYLGEGLIGLLLTHTDQAGQEGFTRNVDKRAVGLQYTVTSGTYPDQIFDKLLAESQNLSDTLPYFLEHETDHGEIELLLKRCLDIAGALVLMIVASPIMLVTAIAVKATSPGPVIYKQVRLGRKGIPFNFYKFRSMRTNADERVHREYVASLIKGKHDDINQGDADKPHFKLKSDSRVTRVGKIIRKTSIDELPQLYNVLKGDMSLVGPRPPIPYETDNYQSWHLRRVLEGRPGITGLWQVEGRNRVPFDEMVRMDMRYTRTWSLWLDLKILAKTVTAVLRFDGEG